MDSLSKEARSAIMAKVRSHGNRATELEFIRLLKKHRVTGWRRRQSVFGNPDFIFRRERLAIFVDGCFWHGCGKCYRRPSSNQEYWDNKFRRNRTRDRKVVRELKKLGWRVVRIWEHSLKEPERVLARILRAISARRKVSGDDSWHKNMKTRQGVRSEALDLSL